MKKALLGVIAAIVLCFGGALTAAILAPNLATVAIAASLASGLLLLGYKVVDKIV